MRSKIFIVGLINAFWALMPQNIIGCAEGPDPKDYYTGFFSQKHVQDNSLRPFFYSAIIKFYDDWDGMWTEAPLKANVADALIGEWRQYAGNQVPVKDVEALVYEAPGQVVSYMVGKFEGKKLAAPADYDSFGNNQMAAALLNAGKKEAMDYLVFAKTVQQKVYSADPWENPVEKDSLGLMLLYKKAEAAWGGTKDSFIKSKYAFMRCRIAFYAGNYALCLKVVDSEFGDAAPATAVKPMAIGYKAGCYFKTGKNNDAALWFARAFQMAPQHRKKNFLGFFWSTQNGNHQQQATIMAMAANNREKALIAGLFAAHGLGYGLDDMKRAYSLDPQCELLPLLAVREIKKLEENYLSPKLDAQKGAVGLFYIDEKKVDPKDLQHAEKVRLFMEELAGNKSLSHNALYRLSAAYTAYLSGNPEMAVQLAGEVGTGGQGSHVREQALLINLLATVGRADKINAFTEAELLPMAQALYRTAEGDMEYRLFTRNFFARVLAPKYLAQGDSSKGALCLGVSNLGHLPAIDDPEGYYSGFGIPGIEFVRSEFTSPQAIALQAFMGSNTTSPFEKFLIEKSSFTRDEVTDFIGTSYLRDHNWQAAIEWLERAGKKEELIGYAYNSNTYDYDKVNVNPFFDYLNDWQRYEKPLSKPMTKLDLARKMQELTHSLDTCTNQAQKGKLAYLLASAYYNLSYYGNAWMALDYSRSTHLWNNGKYAGWQKEYFEVNKAKKYYQMAYQLSAGNKEFQAAAYFLVAKCAQRQIPRPDFDYDNWKAGERAEKDFQRRFKNNPLFPQFKKDFGATRFYKYAMARCSYLADFDKRK